ncbi:MAG: acyl-CoA dehydrogenase family protein [Pyrinomonadaceae bacterium]
MQGEQPVSRSALFRRSEPNNETNIFDEDHRIFRDSLREFVKREIVPFHEQWEKDGMVPREVWRNVGEHGGLCARQ